MSSEIHQAFGVVTAYSNALNGQSFPVEFEIGVGGDVDLRFTSYAIAMRFLDLLQMQALDSIEIKVVPSARVGKLEA